jgi:hypothetical protein
LFTRGFDGAPSALHCLLDQNRRRYEESAGRKTPADREAA